tara:strand:- start:788 stop:1048 length:261 start_codon:yes stop_codon:yes gene_type:complete
MKTYGPTAKLIIESEGGTNLISGIDKAKPFRHDSTKTYVRIRGTVAGKLTDKLYSFLVDTAKISISKWDECIYYKVQESDVRIGNC